MALSFVSGALSSKPSTSSVVNNGRVFNTRVVSQPVSVIYGQGQIGGNLTFIDERVVR
jgi:hypothetical protein